MLRVFCVKITGKKLWVLILCVLAFFLNQLDRFLFPVLSRHIAQDLHYGEKSCLNSNNSTNQSIQCHYYANEQNCSLVQDVNNKQICVWDYNGQGLEFQIIAGPVFLVVNTIAGIALSYLTVWFKPHRLLALFLMIWSIFTAMSGVCQSYWELALTRFALGIGEAGCTPFAAAMIAELYEPEVRGTAMGIYTFGIYFGYSAAFAFGNFVLKANVMGQGWRSVFVISALLGLPVATLLYFTVNCCNRTSDISANLAVREDEQNLDILMEPKQSCCGKIKELFITFLSPPLLLFCLSCSIREGGGYMWAVDGENYLQSIGQTSEQIGSYMSWIPLVGGSLGAFLGGLISDRVVKKKGIRARILALVVSLLIATPLVSLVLILKPPISYILFVPAYIAGEMWIGVVLTCIMEMVPERIRPASVALYLFIVTNIGGNLPLLIPVLRRAFTTIDQTTAFRNAMLVLFPGLYFTSSLLFLLTILVHYRYNNNNNYQNIEHESSDIQESSE